MTHTFTDALDFVLQQEGSFVNDPHDPGGMTNLGVTARVWQQWTQRPATEQVMRALRQVDVQPLYKADYWGKIAGDKLPIALALCVFDFAVNAGPSRAVKTLQGICGATKDGVPGDGTMRAVQAYITGIGLAKLIERFCDARRDYYRELDGFLRFGKGWLARVDRVEKEALGWIG